MTQRQRPSLRSPRIQRAPKAELQAPAAPETAAPEPGPRDVAGLQRALGNAGFARMISRQSSGAPGVLFRAPQDGGKEGGADVGHAQVGSGRYVGDLPGATSNRREDVLHVLNRLYGLWSVNAEQYAEYDVISKLEPGTLVSPDQIPGTIQGLKKNSQPHLHQAPAKAVFGLAISAPVGTGQPNAKSDVIALQNYLKSRGLLNAADFDKESAAANAANDAVAEGVLTATLEALSRLKASALVNPAGPEPAGAPLSEKQKEDVEKVLAPGKDESFVNIVGGRSYKQDLEAALSGVVKKLLPDSKTRLAAEKMPMQTMEDIGGRAKEVTDQKFGSLAMGPPLKAGTPASGANIIDHSLEDASAVELTRYFLMNYPDLLPVHKAHKAVPSRGEESEMIIDLIISYSKANKTDLETIDRAWPAMASNGVIRMSLAKATTEQGNRQLRWRNFGRFIHEYLHTITHFNYRNMAQSLGGTKEGILVEGVTSLYAEEVWQSVKSGLEANAGLRWAVEGASLPYDPKVLVGPTPYPQMADAQRIQTIVKEDNLKSAYFGGKTETVGFALQAPPENADFGTKYRQYEVPKTGISTLADVAFDTGTSVDEIARVNGLPVNATVKPEQLLSVPVLPQWR